MRMTGEREREPFSSMIFFFQNLQSFRKITAFISQLKQTKQKQFQALK